MAGATIAPNYLQTTTTRGYDCGASSQLAASSTLRSGNQGAWNWQYGTHNGVKLASNHTNTEGASIHMGTVAVFDKVEDAFFTNPARGLSQLR